MDEQIICFFSVLKYISFKKNLSGVYATGIVNKYF